MNIQFRFLGGQMLENGIQVEQSLHTSCGERVQERTEADVQLPGVVVRALLVTHLGNERYVDEVATDILERRSRRTVVDDHCGIRHCWLALDVTRTGSLDAVQA